MSQGYPTGLGAFQGLPSQNSNISLNPLPEKMGFLPLCIYHRERGTPNTCPLNAKNLKLKEHLGWSRQQARDSRGEKQTQLRSADSRGLLEGSGWKQGLGWRGARI